MSYAKSCCSISRSSKQPLERNSFSITRHNKLDIPFQFIKGGKFIVGTTDDDPDCIQEDGEAIRQTVVLQDFYLSKYPVTNAQFDQFIKETNYVTDAEKYGWSYVFHNFISTDDEHDIIGVADGTPWWNAVNGAYWRLPEGQSSTIEHRLDHPVVHVSWNDASAYASWANKRLPTEAEWEYAASGGVINQKFPWGNHLHEKNNHHANVWQGDFPYINSGEDGFIGTAPVNSYEPNTFGLYTMIGNVWEWSADSFTTRFPNVELNEHVKLIKGGSYLCHACYCNRYRISARTFNTVDSSAGHIGFRLAMDGNGC